MINFIDLKQEQKPIFFLYTSKTGHILLQTAIGHMLGN